MAGICVAVRARQSLTSGLKVAREGKFSELGKLFINASGWCCSRSMVALGKDGAVMTRKLAVFLDIYSRGVSR